MQDELTLLHRARALDAEALAQIHDTYYVPIYRYIAMRVNDRETAEDLSSEVFTRLLQALRDKSAPQNTLRGWLFAVAARVVNDHFRQHYRIHHTELEESLPGTEDGPERVLEARMTQKELRQALQTLTEEQQHVLALRFGFDMPIKEVAHALGKSEGSIKMLQARAVAMLTRKLQPGATNA